MYIVDLVAMPLNRRKKLLLGGGVLMVLLLLLAVYYMMQSKPAAAKPKPQFGSDPAAADTSYIPPAPAYPGAGDSTADGTPVDGTGPTVDPTAPGASTATPSATTPTTADAGGPSTYADSAAGTSSSQVVVDCAAKKADIMNYYKTKISATLSPEFIGINAVDSNICDAGFKLMAVGTTTVSGVDSRRFTFTPSGITMGSPGSGTTVPLPTMISIPTTKIDAPPANLITNFGTYFKKYAGQSWNVWTAGGSTIAPDLESCQRACYTTAGCGGVNYNPTTGRCSPVLSLGNPVLSTSADMDFYQRLPTNNVIPAYIPAGDTTNYLANFTKFADKFYSTAVAGSIKNFSVNSATECAARCQSDPACIGFTHHIDRIFDQCNTIIKDTGQLLSSNSGATFYKLNPNSIRTAPIVEATPVIAPPVMLWNPPTTGRCGPDYSNSRCPSGQCCSPTGYCGGSIGTTSTWCVNSGIGWLNGVYDGITANTVVNPAQVIPVDPNVYSATGGVSTNERCGPRWGNTKCPAGLCCSSSDWCGPAVGTTTAWCSNAGRGVYNGSYDGV